MREENRDLDESKRYLKRVDMGVHPGDSGPPIVSVIFGDDKLLDLAEKTGIFAVDGTFNIVDASTTRTGPSIQMVSVTMKCPLTGRTLTPMTQVSKWKTSNSRKLVIHVLFTALKERGMRGPLDTQPDGPTVGRRLLCVDTDFESSLLFGAAGAWIDVWGREERADESCEDSLLQVASSTSASCDVHRKRFLRRRCGNASNSEAYKSCVLASRFTNEDEARTLLEDMRDPNSSVLGEKAGRVSGFPEFADWIDTNQIIRISSQISTRSRELSRRLTTS